MTDSLAAANGTYQMQFSLYDALSGGTQLGTTITNNTVTVTNGVFTVQLDFSPATPFATGADRWIEMAVRKAADPPGFTLLSPRQQVTSAPYATRAASAANADNAAQLGGVAASQYVVTTDPRMTDARPPTVGSSDYIQNQNAGAQAASNFNIDGTGTANIFSATTQYNLGTNRILGNPGTNNLFAGVGAGNANTTGSFNAFFGRDAGNANTTGGSNAFFGAFAGDSNTTGSFNAFFGASAGQNNTTGGSNAFFGMFAGDLNTTGVSNAFFGTSAGQNNTTGGSNAFFGREAGINSVIGVENAFFGFGAGQANSSGNSNTAFGYSANFGTGGLVNANAIGYRALVGASNSLVLGSINGVNGAITDTNVGIGTTTPQYRLHVRGENVRVEGNTNSTLPRFSLNFTGGGADQKKWQNYAGTNTLVFSALNDAEDAESFWLKVNRGTGTAISSVEFPTNVAIGVPFSPDRLAVAGNVSLLLAAGGATQVCHNASNQLSTCSSSLRYKTNVGRFGLGLSLVNQLKPITFEWKDGGMKDVGFGAEDVANIDPRFVTYNDKGEVEGVKYDRLSVVFVNAFKEQQQMIEKQQTQIEAQQAQINALKELVCAQNPAAKVCRQQEEK